MASPTFHALVLLLLLLLSFFTTLSSPQATGSPPLESPPLDPLPAINRLISSSSWGTLEELSSAAVEEFKGREHEGTVNWHYYLGVSQYQQGKLQDAISAFEEALSLQPSFGILSSLGTSYLSAFRLDDATQAYKMAFNKLAEADNDADPADKVRTATGISKSMRWNVDFSPTLQLYENMVKVGAEDDTVRNLLKEVWADVDFREFMDPSKYVEAISDSPPSISPPISASASPAGKLTVNMVSSDWDVHPVSTLSRGLLQNLLESSDVSLNVVSVNNNDDPAGGGGGWWKTNITGMIEKTYKPDDNQQRSILYVEGDVKQRSNSLRKLNGDVCVDLNGRTMGNGLELFNEQICKLQVTYLGLPQSTGVRAMDYIITDRSTVGELESGEEKWYSEMQAITSNQCYMTNDHASIMGHIKTRYPFRLFDTSAKRKVLIANLGNWQKITPHSLDVWSNVLRAVEGGVMLFYRHKGSESAFRNVKLEMAARGIHPKRIVITEMHPWVLHTWYKTQIDMILDTVGKAGHTVNLDGEWAGVPIVTKAGGGMEGRAGASITGGGVRDLKEYEDVGMELGNDGMLRLGYREMIQKRTTRAGGVYDVKGRGEEFIRVMEGLWDVKENKGGKKLHFVQGKMFKKEGEISVESRSDEGGGKDLVDVTEGYTVDLPGQGSDLLIHVGCKEKKAGWTCLDMVAREEVDLVSDMADIAAVKDGNVKAIYASHVLEHRHYGKIGPQFGPQGNSLDVLTEWHRILEKDGHLMISVPDLEALSGMFINERLGEGVEKAQRRFHIMRIMFGGNAEDGDVHMAGYDFDIIGGFLEAAGFCRIKRVREFGLFNDSSVLWWDWEKGQTVHGGDVGEEGGVQISLNVIARKC